MDVVCKKKASNVSGSDIDEELEGCLEGLEDIADEIIASGDSECEPEHKEVAHKESQECTENNIKVKDKEEKMSSQAESHKAVNNELVQSIKKYIQDLVKVKNETIETLAANKNTEAKVNNSGNSGFEKNGNHVNNSDFGHSSTKDNFNCSNLYNLEVCSDGEIVSGDSMDTKSHGNKYEIIEGTEVISDNSEWDYLESGECSSSEEALHKLCDDDAEYLSDATTVTGEDKSQIKKSVQEYYKKSEDCFLVFYNKIKHNLTDRTKIIVDSKSFKSKLHLYSDSFTKKLCRISSGADYNRAKLILREFKRKSSLYKKNHRHNDTGYFDNVTGNAVLMGIVSQFDSHLNQELSSRVSDDLKLKLSRLKKNVKKYERKVGLRKKEHSKKRKMLPSEIGRVNNDSIELNFRSVDKTKKSPEKSTKNTYDNIHLNYKNTDRRKLRYSPDKDKVKKSPEKSRSKHFESHHNQHDHSNRRDSVAVGVKHNNSNTEKLKVIDKLNLSEKRANKKLTILSYLEDCEQSVDGDRQVSKERKSGTNILKKKQESFESKEKKTSTLSGTNKQPGNQTDKKKLDPNYDDAELFITYSELVENGNTNFDEQRKEQKVKDGKDLSVFAMTLSSEYGKHSSVIPFLQDEADVFNIKAQSKESNQVSCPTRECGSKSNLHHESQCPNSEKTKPYQRQISNTSLCTESHLSVRSISTSPFRGSSRSRSNSQNRLTVERERHSRRSRSRSNSIGRSMTEKERSRRSRSHSSGVIIEKEKYYQKTAPYAYRRRRSRSRSRNRYRKRYNRSPSPHYRKRYRSRSRTWRHTRSEKSKRSRRKYSSSSDERDKKSASRTPPRSFIRRSPTKTFGDELRRKLKEENEKALALLKLTLAAQDKGHVANTELIPFTSSPDKQRKEDTYKMTEEAKESSSSAKTESSVSVQQQPASLTPPLIPLPPLPPNEPQPAPPLPTTSSDVTVVATYTSYVPMTCPPPQPPPNYVAPPPPRNDMYMPYMNTEMHHHPYMYPPPGYQMRNEGVPPMFHQAPPQHMMPHPQNSYGPPFSYMHNTYQHVPMPPYQNAPYPPSYPQNFTCHQNIVTMSSESLVKKTAPQGPVLMEIGSDSDNSVHSPVLSQNPTIQEAIQFVKHKMLKNDIKKAITEGKTGVDNDKNKRTENTSEVIIIEDGPKKLEENKHKSDDSVKSDSKINENNNKNTSRKIKPIKFSLQSKARPVIPLNNTDVFGNSDNDCEIISSKEETSEQPSSKIAIIANKATIERGPVFYSDVVNKTSVKICGSSEKGNEHASKIKDKQIGPETKIGQTVTEVKENAISSKTENNPSSKNGHESDQDNKSNKSELNNHKNKNKINNIQNNDKITMSKQEKQTPILEELKTHVKEDVNSTVKKKTVSASSAKVEKTSVERKTDNIKTIRVESCETETLITEKQTELQEPKEQMKAIEKIKVVDKDKSTELNKSETKGNVAEPEGRNEIGFTNTDKSSEVHVDVFEIAGNVAEGEGRNETEFANTDKFSEVHVDIFEINGNETETSVGKTKDTSEIKESDVKNITLRRNETKVLYKEQDEKHIKKKLSESHYNETHRNIAGNKDAKENVTCQESVVPIASSNKEAPKKQKEKFVGDNSNECSEYTGMSVKQQTLNEAEHQKLCVSILSDDKQNTEVSKKENIDCVEFTSQDNNKCELSKDEKKREDKKHLSDTGLRSSNFNTDTKSINQLKNKVLSSLSGLPNEENSVASKTPNEPEPLGMPVSGTSYDKNQLREGRKIIAEKEDMSGSGIQGSHFNLRATDEVLNEENNVPKKTMNETEDLDIPVSTTVCELNKDKKQFPMKEDISASGIQNSRNIQMITEVGICEDRGSKEAIESPLKKRSKNKEASLHELKCITNDLLQNEDLLDPKTNAKRILRNRNKEQYSSDKSKNNQLEEDKVKGDEIETFEEIKHSSDTAGICKTVGIPVQKETVKQTSFSEMNIETENQEKKKINSSSETKYEMSGVKVLYRACPLSKKTPRELTMMFLNHSIDTVDSGVKLKDLRIKLERVKMLPLSNTHCKVPFTSEDVNLVNKVSSDSSQNKREKTRKMSIQNDGCLLQTVTSMEEKDEDSKPLLIQPNKLSETVASKLSESHKKVLEILRTFSSNEIIARECKKKRVILKLGDSVNTINITDIVPLSNCFTTVSKPDKLNPAQGQNKEVDFTKEEEWVKSDNTVADREVKDTDSRPVLKTTENTLLIASDSHGSDQYKHDMNLNCKKQRIKHFEHKEDSNDSSKVINITDIRLQLCKELNSETEDSLLGEFASNDSNASLTCEQVSSNSLILKINRSKSKRSKKRKIKLHSLADNDVSNSNLDESNTNENTATSIYDEEKISLHRFTDTQDVSNSTVQSDANRSNTELAVYDFKDESSCDTGLEETYLPLKRRKSLNKKKCKTKRKRKFETDDKSDDLVVEPKLLRSSKSKSSKLKEETGGLSSLVSSEEMSKPKTGIPPAVSENKQSSGESQTVTCVSVLEENKNCFNLLSNDNIKNVDSSSLWEKISQCLNVKRRSVTTQVRYKQFQLQGEVSVEDTDMASSSETEMLSLNDVISALTRLT